MPSQQVPMGSPGVEVEAQTLQVGDEIYMPNSRHPQAVTAIDRADGADEMRIRCDDAQVMVGLTWKIRKVEK